METVKERFLVCVDSDGCAIDSMTIKHEKAFGPAFVEIWKVSEAEQAAVLKDWNDLNLYRITRGINRFQGLVEILTMYPQYADAEQLVALRNWTQTTPALSADALKAAYEKNGHETLRLALAWSNRVNELIGQLPLALPFEQVMETLTQLKAHADLAVVSSANQAAIEEEWKTSGLYEQVDYFFSQSDGTKSDCIKKLLEKGYQVDKTLMVGDAIGDYQAAEKNKVWFYPILAGLEVTSWKQLQNLGLPQFLHQELTEEGQEALLNVMKENFKSQ